MTGVDELIEKAGQVNASYRSSIDERELEVGFLYGTAELIIAINGLLVEDSYHDRREQIARAIDRSALKQGAPYTLIT